MAVPQFTGKPPPIDKIAFLPDDLSLIEGVESIEAQGGSIEANDEEEMDMPERNDEGYYRVDDMFLDEAQYRANFGTEEERQGHPDKSYRWPGPTIPYTMESSVPSDRKQKIRDALAVLNDALVNCIAFE